MHTQAKPARALLLVAASALVASRAEASSLSTYLSLGDSLAYGTGMTQDAAPGSSASQGYVSQFASTLGQVNGGTMPNVINVALPNETLGSFSAGNPSNAANTNYSTPQDTQSGMFLHYMAAELAAGHKIDTISVALGSADINNMLNAPGFASLSLGQQAAKVEAELATIQSQYTAVMSQIRNVLPNAKIDLVGAYNPYHATPNNPVAPIAEPAFLGLNKIIQGEASTFGATYVDTYTKFLGNESTYTNIVGGSGNITPTPLGFSAIATQLDSTVVPEPSTLFLAGFGLAGLAGQAWRRRRARVA